MDRRKFLGGTLLLAARLAAQDNLARLRPATRNGFSNGGWKYDAYPSLESLDAGKTITVARIKGPAQINKLHTSQLGVAKQDGRTAAARSVVLEIFFDDMSVPAVSVPLGDFFADGTGEAANFSTQFVEKAPRCYNCFIPMPFAKSARVTLRNDSDRDFMNYTYMEWETLPAWQQDLGYFHASWQRHVFQLTEDTIQLLFRLQGPGHLVGQYWNVQTDEPTFDRFQFVMEGNVEHRIDGEEAPSINYLGSEDSFDFSWGWQDLFSGYNHGINYLVLAANKPARLSVYRFRDRDAIRFGKSLEVAINWTKEFRGVWAWTEEFMSKLRRRNAAGGGWVDYAVTAYWYSADPGGAGVRLPPVDERIKPLLRRNPAAPKESPPD